MRSLSVFVLLMFSCLIFSCKSQKQTGKDYSGEIDSLLTELRTLDDSLGTLNIHEVQQINDSLRRFYDTAEVRDTLMERYRLYERSRNVMDWYDNVHREITFSRSHLNALKRDFKTNDLPDSTKQKELKKEKQIVASIRERFNEEYESLRKEVRELLNGQPVNE